LAADEISGPKKETTCVQTSITCRAANQPTKAEKKSWHLNGSSSGGQGDENSRFNGCGSSRSRERDIPVPGMRTAGIGNIRTSELDLLQASIGVQLTKEEITSERTDPLKSTSFQPKERYHDTKRGQGISARRGGGSLIANRSEGTSDPRSVEQKPRSESIGGRPWDAGEKEYSVFLGN